MTRGQAQGTVPTFECKLVLVYNDLVKAEEASLTNIGLIGNPNTSNTLSPTLLNTWPETKTSFTTWKGCNTVIHVTTQSQRRMDLLWHH